MIEASDGDEAWTLARERLPDLVVLDVMMPGMSGWEVCRKIRQDAALAHTGVLMLTGIGESLNEATSPLFGADEYIDKPFDFEKLDEKIMGVLEKRAAQREAVPRPIAKPRSASPQRGNGVGGPAKAAPAKARVRKGQAGESARDEAEAKKIRESGEGKEDHGCKESEEDCEEGEEDREEGEEEVAFEPSTIGSRARGFLLARCTP